MGPRRHVGSALRPLGGCRQLWQTCSMHEPTTTEPARRLRPAHEWPRERWAWRARVRGNPVAYFWYRIGVAVVGGVMMVGAALTGWLPGPGGIPLFMLGLLVLSSEFAWAHGVMLWFRHQFERLAALPTSTKRWLTLATVLAVLATWYTIAAWYGLPPWLPEGLAVQLERIPLIQR